MDGDKQAPFLHHSPVPPLLSLVAFLFKCLLIIEEYLRAIKQTPTWMRRECKIGGNDAKND